MSTRAPDSLRLLDDAFRRRFPPAAAGVSPDDSETPRAQTHLLQRFFARDVQCRRRAAQRIACLQQHGRLADARIAAEQGDRAQHQPAAEHAIELVHARGDARLVRFGDFGQALRPSLAAANGRRSGFRAWLTVTSANPRRRTQGKTLPLQALVAALIADKDLAGLGHELSDASATKDVRRNAYRNAVIAVGRVAHAWLPGV